MFTQAILEQLNQFRVHVSKVIRNIEAHYFFVRNRFWKFTAQSFGVTSFHHKNHVCPANQSFGYFYPRAIFSSR